MSYPSELPDKENINGYYLPFNYDESTGTWNDLVGTNHFTQSDANSRPLLKDDIVNSKFKYVLFTASPWRRMTLPTDIAYENNSNNHTIFLVARRGNVINADGTFSSYDNNGRFLQDQVQNYLLGWWEVREGVFHVNSWLDSNNKGYENNWAICVLRRIDGSNKSWAMGYTGGNGGPYSASGISRNPATGYYTATGGNSSTIRDLRFNDGRYNGERCDFHVGELLIYKTGLSDADTETVLEYLEARYFGADGISGTGTMFQNDTQSGVNNILAPPISYVDRNYNSNWVVSVDKWDSYRSIGYRGKVDVEPIQSASVIAGGGGFDGSFNVVDASFRTQGDASSNWFSSNHPAQMAFNNDISFIGGQYFAVEDVSAYQNGSIVSDSDNSAIKLDFLFPYPRTATEYKIFPPNEISNYNALYMPNRWCIYGSNSETIDTSLPSTESNGYFLLDIRTDTKPWSAHDASLISLTGSKKYVIANPGLYRQYRMSILQNSGDPSGNINIGELIYYEGGVGPLVGDGALDGRSDLSGGLAFHGDVSGINGFESTIMNNYTVDVSLNRFTLNGDLQPELTLYRGETYNFNQSDIDNSGQRLFVSNDSDGRLVTSTTYQLLAGGNGSENSNTLRGTGGNDGIVSSNNWSTGYPLSRVFNGTLDNAQDGWHTTDNTYPANLIFTFPNPVVIYKYKVWPRQRPSNYSDTHPPKLWQIRGVSLTDINDYDENDSSTYTVLHEQNVPQLWNVDWFDAVQTTDITNDTKRQEYIFSTPGLYKHYIFHVIESQYGATSHTFIGEIAYYGGTPSSYSLSDNSAGFITTGTLGTDLSSSWTIPIDAPDTMYYASDGSANAGGIINIENIPNYNIVNLFDGNNNSLYKSPTGTFTNYQLSPNSEFAVKFELPSKKKILKYDIKNTNIKSWTLRGCDNSAIYDRNDSNTYELLHGVSDFVDSSKSCIVSNPKDYIYYVLDVTASNTADSAELGELIYYDTGSYPSAGAGSLDGSSGDVGGLQLHGDVKGVGGKSDWAALSGGLGAHGDISGVKGFEPLLNYTVDVSLNRFTLNGDLQPELTLYRGETYQFNQSDINNSGHELFISTNSGSVNNSTRYPITPLTSNNSSNCIVYESSQSSTSQGGWRAFNHTNTNQDDCWHASGSPAGYTSGIANSSRSFNGINGDWVKIQFTNGGFPLKEIQIYQRNDAGNSAWYMFADRCVDDGYIYGSNNGFNWTQLKYFTGLKGSGWVSGTPKTIDVNSNISYSYYVLLVTKLSGSEAILNIGQIDLYEALATPYTTGFTNNGGTSGTDLISTWTIPNDISDIMYYASDVSGPDAGGIINILNYSNYDVSNVYDGSNIVVYKSPIGAFDNYDLSAGKEFAIKMDFPSSKKIFRYDLNNINLKSWTLRGTDNSLNYDRTDSNTYEVLDSIVDFSYGVSNNSGNSGNSGFSNTVDSVLNGDAGLSTLESSITLWIDGNNIDGTNNSSYSNGNNITTWKDLSSKGNDLEPRGDPTFLDNGGPLGSNKAVVNFTDDAFRTSGNIDMNIIFIVHKTKNEDFLFDFRSGNGSYIWTGGGGVNWIVHQNGTNTNSAYSSNYIMNDQWSVTVFVGGSYNATVYLMGRYTDNERSSGQVAEMIIFDTTLTSQEINIIEYYLAVKWNLTSIGNYDDTGVTYNPSSGYGGGTITRIISNPKDYTYYVLDSSASNDISYAEIGELIVYDSRVKVSNSTSVFNGTLSDASDAFISDSSVFSNNSLNVGSEFSVKFEFPTKKYITSYRIWPQIDGSMNSPSDWYLHGCDVSSLYDRTDESTYNVLDVRTEENSWPVSSSSSIDDLSGYNEYTIIDPGNYSYYVLDVTASNNASLCSIGEIALYESERIDVTTTREPEAYENHQLTINMGASQETSDWEIGEIIVFNKKLTSDEEEKIVSYLENTYYGTDGFEPVGNNRTLRLTRKNLKLSEVYSAMDPSSRDIEYFNQTDYNNIVNLNLSSVNIQDISNVTVKNSDLTSRLINDTSYTNILGQPKGYTQSTFDAITGGGVGRGLSNFRGSRAGGGIISVDITGTEITSYNSYRVHEFKYDSNNNTSGQTIYTVTVRGKITADFLMIAGGGGGGSPSSASGTSGGNSWEPGGGGAGELIYQTNIEFKAGTYLFKVGDGGENRVNTSNNNGPTGYDTSIIGGQLNNTYNSSINGFIANGGQSGSTYASNSYNTFTPKGGSGGGNAHNTANASWASTPESGTLTYNDYSSFNPSSTPNEVGYFGNKGGIDDAGGNWGGGGGGAGGIPSSASGGVGKQYSIRDGSTLVYYAGGGAGANLNGLGGQGGGGDGGTNSVRAGGVGTPHTGSGGGAGYGTEHGGKGGSGLIIFRYK